MAAMAISTFFMEAPFGERNLTAWIGGANINTEYHVNQTLAILPRMPPYVGI